MASAKKTKISLNDDVQLQLLYGDDARFKYWESHLFNEVYLKRDLPEKQVDKWNSTEEVGFQHFMNVLRNLAAEYKGREKELSNWSETETINNWVKHVLDGLGWKNNCTGVQNPFLEETSFRYDSKTYRTDILIVDHPREKQYVNQATGDSKLVEARNSVIMPIEVKYWQRLEEFRQGRAEEKGRHDIESDDLERTATPNEQIVQYMGFLKKSWGILTDGAKWRLFNSELSSEDVNRYYEFNLYSLIQSINTEENEIDRNEVLEAAKYFYFFFSKDTFSPGETGEESFVGEVLRYSKKYVNKVEEDLKERFVKAMNIACNGLYRIAKATSQSQDLTAIRNVAESTLFNILFIKSLESRGTLPMSSTDYKKISLSNTIDKIERFDPEKEEMLNNRELERAFKKGNGNSFVYTPEGTELHERIVRLTMVINEGSSSKDQFGFEISGFKETVFSDDEWKIFKSCKISNRDWVKILFQLGYADSESLNRKYQQIPYSYFTPRQLGSIYESFLEFKLDRAATDMIFFKHQWQDSKSVKKIKELDSLPRVSKGDLFFTPDNEDRKATGSYYTPDYIVQFIVAETVSPMLIGRSSSEILDLKICDPAMGSGHFLVSTLNYILKAYLNALVSEGHESREIPLAEVKREILKKCIYGIDLNPRAVKLAKMSLWLETSGINSKSSNLERNLVARNSLVIAEEAKKHKFNLSSESWLPLSLKDDFGSHLQSGFDAIVGNPPYNASNGDSSEMMYSKLYPQEKNLNTANLFVSVSKVLTKESGRIGLIIPKSYYYSSTWEDARNRDLDCLQATVDVSEAFPDVLLEQVIIVLGPEVTDKVRTFLVENDQIRQEGSVKKEFYRDLGILFSGYGADSYEVYLRVKNHSIAASDILKLKRGFLIQKSLGKGTAKIFRGRNIQKFHRTDSIDRVDESIHKNLAKENPWLKDAIGLSQNIVAHVTKPTDQIVLMACKYSNEIGLDNLSYILPEVSWVKNYPNAITSFFNSWLVSWYMYRFCYAKAVRTMRFDNCHVEKMPFPKSFVPSGDEKDKLSIADRNSISKVASDFSGHLDQKFISAAKKLVKNFGGLSVLEFVGLEINSKRGSQGLLALVEAVLIAGFQLEEQAATLSKQYDLRANSGLPDYLAVEKKEKRKKAA